MVTVRRGISSHSCDDNNDDHDDDDDVGHDNYSATADTSHHIREDRSHNACDAEGRCSLFTVHNDVEMALKIITTMLQIVIMVSLVLVFMTSWQ